LLFDFERSATENVFRSIGSLVAECASAQKASAEA
jgi:hypothetical protein